MCKTGPRFQQVTCRPQDISGAGRDPVQGRQCEKPHVPGPARGRHINCKKGGNETIPMGMENDHGRKNERSNYGANCNKLDDGAAAAQRRQ